MQNQNGTMNGPGIGAPMRRVKHTTTIEEPDKNQNGVDDRFEGGGGLQNRGSGMNFLQNMVHPAFRALGGPPQAGVPQSGMGGTGPVPNPFQRPPSSGMGMPSPMPTRPPMQVGVSPFERLRRGGLPPMLIPFFQRLFGQGV